MTSEFEILWDTHRDGLFSYFLMRTDSVSDAQDLLQSTTEDALKGFDTLRNKRAFKKWIFKIAYYNLMDFYKAKGRSLPMDTEDIHWHINRKKYQSISDTCYDDFSEDLLFDSAALTFINNEQEP